VGLLDSTWGEQVLGSVTAQEAHTVPGPGRQQLAGQRTSSKAWLLQERVLLQQLLCDGCWQPLRQPSCSSCRFNAIRGSSAC